MRNHQFGQYLLVALVAGVLGFGVDAWAQTQTSSPDQRLEVTVPIAEKLSRLLPASEKTPAALGTEAERLLVSLLPESNRKLCGDLVAAWGPARSEAVLTARLLHVHAAGDQFSALLAYRCGFRPIPQFDAVFDERPALLVRNGNGTSLTLISPYRPEECCDPHSVEFLKALPLADGQLLELGVQSVSYGDGADSSSQYELVWIADPAAHVALRIASRTENDGYDADTEESHQSVCDAKVRYEKDAAAKLTAIVGETACTEDKVQKPSETVRYIWDAAVGRFNATGARTKEQASTAR